MDNSHSSSKISLPSPVCLLSLRHSQKDRGRNTPKPLPSEHSPNRSCRPASGKRPRGVAKQPLPPSPCRGRSNGETSDTTEYRRQAASSQKLKFGSGALPGFSIFSTMSKMGSQARCANVSRDEKRVDKNPSTKPSKQTSEVPEERLSRRRETKTRSGQLCRFLARAPRAEAQGHPRGNSDHTLCGGRGRRIERRHLPCEAQARKPPRG